MPDMIPDRFAHSADSSSSPARDAFAIAPDDNLALTALPKALMACTDGTVALRAVDGDADVTIPVSAGQIIPIRAAYVRASGTTADLVGLA